MGTRQFLSNHAFGPENLLIDAGVNDLFQPGCVQPRTLISSAISTAIGAISATTTGGQKRAALKVRRGPVCSSS